ncbi:MAG: tyrosine-type recombinase/integrase [bacterium]
MGLFKRKNSPYYFMKFQLNGRLIYESTKTANKKLAEEIYLNRRHEIITGIEPERERKVLQKFTFNELTERYLSYTDGRLKSHSRLKSFVKKLIKTFGNIRLDDFNLILIENMQSEIIKNNLSVAYANRLTAILKRMFTKALEWEMISEGVLKRIRSIKLIKGEVKRLRYLDEDEAERLIGNCGDNLRAIVITALNTGMRKSEILRLTWDRVDLKNRIILLDKTKNGERREIPVNETLYGVLSGIVRRIDCGYVFFNPKTLRHLDNVKKSFAAALRKSHILDFRFHDLRHTFASRLVMKGIDLTTVRDLMGHKDITMTLRYSHLSQSHIKNAVAILDDRCKIVAVDYKEEINNS